MVLPDRIELSTSPLPMECSTTELRQHARETESAQEAPTGGRFLPQGPRWRKHVAGWKGHQNGPKSGFAAREPVELRQLLPNRFPVSAAMTVHGFGPSDILRTSNSPHSDRPAMTDDRDKVERQAAAAKDSRQDRLKLALRENLKRRKSQARGRSEPARASSESGDASLDDANGNGRTDR